MNGLDMALMVVHRLNMNDGVCSNIMHRFPMMGLLRVMHCMLRLKNSLNVCDRFDNCKLSNMRRSSVATIVSVFERCDTVRSSMHVSLKQLFVGRQNSRVLMSIDVGIGCYIRRLGHHTRALVMSHNILGSIISNERRLSHHSGMASMAPVVVGEFFKGSGLCFSFCVEIHLIYMWVHTKHLVIVCGC